MRNVFLIITCFFVLINSFSQNNIVPSTIDGLTIWLRSDSVELDASETRVTQLYDLSGNEHHANQSDSDKQPLYNTIEAAIAGHPTVIFDGSNDFMNGTGNLGGITSYTLLCVVRINSRKSYNWIYRNTPIGNNFSFGLSGQGDGKFRYWPQGTSNSVVFDPVVQNNEYHYYSVLTSNDSSVVTRYFFDGIQTGTTNNLVNTHAVNGYTVGALGDAVQTLNGEIVELILYNKYLTNQEQFEVENYFRYRYFPSEYISYIDIDNINIDYGFCDTTISIPNIYTNYLWSNGSTSHEATFNSVGTHWVEATNVYGYVDRDTFEISYPNIAQPNSTLYCPGSSVTWNANLGPHYTYEWSTGETTESIEIDSPGSYFVTVTDTNGCIRVFDPLFIDEDPFATTVSLGPDANLCVGNAVQLTSGATDAVSYLWHTGETTPSIEATVSGMYSVEVENANGCVAEDEVEITILGTAPTMGSNLVVNYCQGEDIAFEDASFTTDGSEIISWSWDFGDGIGVYASETGTHSYQTPGNFVVEWSVESNSGCGNSAQISVEVAPKPSISLASTGSCEGVPFSFFGDQSTPQPIALWSWDFGDPDSGADNTATGANPTHLFSGFGAYDVTLIAEDVNGCRDTAEVVVNVLPAPVVNFTFEEVCLGQFVSFVNQSTVPAPHAIASQQWQFGDGGNSGQLNPNKAYVTHGTYNVTLTVNANNGCSAQLMQPVKIHAIPQPDYTTDAACAGMSSLFVDASLVPAGSVALVEWSFNQSDPVGGFTAEHVFTQTGQNEITQTVTSAFGCVGSNTTQINLTSFLSAEFGINPGAVLAEFPMTFQNQSVGQTSTQWIINGGDTLTTLNAAATFPTSMIGEEIEVVLIVSNASCSDTIVKTFTVLENRTDLAINQLFVQEVNGFYIIGAELENRGSTPISRADLFLRTTNTPLLKETWEGLLEAGEKEIHVFTAQPSSVVMAGEQSYVCVEGRIVLPAQFTDQDLSNNEQCRLMQDDDAVLMLPYPNPVKEDLTIRIVLPEASTITLQVFDGAGRLVQTIAADQPATNGINILHANTSQWRSGIYTLVLISEGSRITAKVMK